MSDDETERRIARLETAVRMREEVRAHGCEIGLSPPALGESRRWYVSLPGPTLGTWEKVGVALGVTRPPARRPPIYLPTEYEALLVWCEVVLSPEHCAAVTGRSQP